MPAETHSRRSSFDREEVARLVTERLAEILEIEEDAVVQSARLRDDLHADDFALIEWAETLEDELSERTVGFRLDDDDLVELDTVSDAIDCVVARLAATNNHAGHVPPVGPPPDAAPPVAAPPVAAPSVDTEAETDALAALESRMGYTFRDRSFLQRALSHRSWCAENVGYDSNERLEFLGDSVLGLVVTDDVFRRFPTLPEGQLSEVRAGVVNARALADVASEMCLGDCLLLGKGEDGGGGRTKQSILADALEAFIAAVYLDGGLDAATRLVLTLFGERIGEAATGPGGRDYKTRLQELAAARSLGRPRYLVRDEGPDHAKRFFATVILDGAASGAGEGNSKKEAEQAAAWIAWSGLQEEEPGAGAT
jgi:ribonuclease-3